MTTDTIDILVDFQRRRSETICLSDNMDYTGQNRMESVTNHGCNGLSWNIRDMTKRYGECLKNVAP